MKIIIEGSKERVTAFYKQAKRTPAIIVTLVDEVIIEDKPPKKEKPPKK